MIDHLFELKKLNLPLGDAREGLIHIVLLIF